MTNNEGRFQEVTCNCVGLMVEIIYLSSVFPRVKVRTLDETALGKALDTSSFHNKS